jgi:hypothetical protein
MENAEIDCKLAEAMGYKELVENGYLWEPSIDMSDAWEVAERFGIDDIRRLYTGEWLVWKRGKSTMDGLTAQAETAQLAICKAALKVIEGSKSDE